LAVGIGGAARADDTLYYRGYFSADATPLPPEGMRYQVDPDTIQPTFYYQYGTRPIYDRRGDEGNDQRGRGRQLQVRPGQPLVLYSADPLPGQYWYDEPGVYAMRNHDLGWPYDQR
jgi:hypothetical protein